MRTRDRPKKVAVRSKSSALMRSHRKARNATNSLNTQLKKKFYNEKINACKGDIKGSWRVINEIIDKSRSPQILIISGTVARKSVSVVKLQMS